MPDAGPRRGFIPLPDLERCPVTAHQGGAEFSIAAPGLIHKMTLKGVCQRWCGCLTASVPRLPRMGRAQVSTPLKTISSSPLWVAFLKDFIVLLLHHNKKGPQAPGLYHLSPLQKHNSLEHISRPTPRPHKINTCYKFL